MSRRPECEHSNKTEDHKIMFLHKHQRQNTATKQIECCIFTCPGCNSSYIGKTNRTLLVRTQEHATTDKESAIYKHLPYCDQIKHIQGLYNLPDIFINNNPPSSAMNKEYLTHTVRVNTKIIDSDDNWNLLLYKEAYHIKRSAPSLNNGLKASRELCLFS